jgi:hypothetical protein
MSEIWRDIKGYECRYKVSRNGEIMSLNYRRTGKKRLMKAKKNPRGYLYITLTKNGIMKVCKIHRIVAETFIPNPNNMPEVNHKDEDKTNNAVENLEWCTRKYNCNYGTRIEKYQKNIVCVELNKTFKSMREAERELGVANASISRCCRGKQERAGGYHWQYAEVFVKGGVENGMD